MHNLSAAHPEAGCVEYHTWWPGAGDPFYQYNIPENTDRTNFYNVNGTPTIKVDGKYPAGANTVETMFLSRLGVPAEATCEASL